jgi:uncharacterized membrane protein YhiD involved in acid resistance
MRNIVRTSLETVAVWVILCVIYGWSGFARGRWHGQWTHMLSVMFCAALFVVLSTSVLQVWSVRRDKRIQQPQ